MPRAGKPRGPQKNELLRRLRDSGRRFQRHMLRLLEKYDQPFEDDLLVQMSTLTYETPQGLRIWGGKLIKERNTETKQDPPVNVVGRLSDSGQTTLEGNEHAPNCTQVLGAESGSSGADRSGEDEGVSACGSKFAVPGRPLENELRRKYLAQVDILLQGEEYFKTIEERKRKDTVMALLPLASPATPAPGGSVSAESPDNPGPPASSPIEWDPSLPCPVDMATVPKNDSPSLLETSSSSCLSSLSFEADDICHVTISDLYVGMLHFMSQLLSSKPPCVISTKTCLGRTWSWRLVHRSGAPMNSTSYPRGKRSRRSPRAQREKHRERERSVPCFKPGKEAGVLRDCKNLPLVARHTSLKVQGVSPEGGKPRLHLPGPWEELQVTPRKYSSLTYLDLNTRYSFDQENRLKTLKWLISPGKTVSRLQVLQDRTENWHREIEDKFEKLHQECSMYSGRWAHLAIPAESWAVGVHGRGSGSSASPRGVEIPRPSVPFHRERRKRLREASENLDRRPFKAARCPPQSPDLFRKTLSANTGVSATIGPLSWRRSRHDEIKDEFDKLHLQCCPTSPPPAKPPSTVRQSPGKARADSHCQDFQKLSLSPQWRIKSPQDSAADEAPGSVWTACAATRDSQFAVQRHRLSYPQMSGDHGESREPSGGASTGRLWPPERVRPAWPAREKKTSLRMEEKRDFS